MSASALHGKTTGEIEQNTIFCWFCFSR